ncbi:MAG: electron transport complex subunit RsxC [Piscirickettsiaceae bacterium]|nr:electron transport complex subunit RsxC [Piscirickettsiaceae bacterium]
MTQYLNSFPGGLKLPGRKRRSTATPIRKMSLSHTLVLPLQQHIGEVATPCVKVDNKVLKGQKIASSNGHISANLHAPSSGTIKEISEHPMLHQSNSSFPSITIETDGQDKWIDRRITYDFTHLSPNDLCHLISDAGIVGLGGAGFPSFIKINSGIHHYVETLIINGAECEPYITCDDVIMRERAQSIIDGIEIMQRALNVNNCVIAIEDNKPEAILSMRIALNLNQRIRDTKIVVIPNLYPTGSEKQLIQVVTGKEIPGSGLPIHIGIVLHNITTAYAIGRAIKHSEPLISRIVTVTGTDLDNSGNFETLLGTPIHELLRFCGTKHQVGAPLIQGGPMMGYNLADNNLPITKTANCILVGVENTAKDTNPLPCIRCGDCATVCPIKLLPQQLYWYSRSRNMDKMQEYSLFNCIECGCCSYVCPSKIPLVQYFRLAKTETTNKKRESQKANIARIRHDNRLERQEYERVARKEKQRKHKITLATRKANSRSEN